MAPQQIRPMYSIPVHVRIAPSYAKFNALSPVSIPSDKTDRGQADICPACRQATKMVGVFPTEEGHRISGICDNCGSRWHRFMDNETGDLFLYMKGVEEDFVLNPFVPEKTVEDGQAEALWVVSLTIDGEEPYEKTWTCPATDLVKTRRLARLRIRKQGLSIKDAVVVQDDEAQTLTITFA